MANLKDILKAGIEEYTGREVESIKLHADSKVEGAWGIRAGMKDGKTIDFIVSAGWGREGTDPEHVANVLEETQFDTWPPVAGPVRFF